MAQKTDPKPKRTPGEPKPIFPLSPIGRRIWDLLDQKADDVVSTALTDLGEPGTPEAAARSLSSVVGYSRSAVALLADQEVWALAIQIAAANYHLCCLEAGGGPDPDFTPPLPKPKKTAKKAKTARRST